MFGFGAYAFIWGTISTTVRQRLVPLQLQGRIASVNMVGVFGGLVIGQLLGGLIAQTWGLTAPVVVRIRRFGDHPAAGLALDLEHRGRTARDRGACDLIVDSDRA